MKPYSFPDIISGQAAAERKKVDAETVFTRIFHVENEGVSANYMSVGRASENKAAQAKDLEEQAYISGFEKGEKEGLESSKSRIETLLISLDQALLGIDKAKEDLFLISEREAVELALSIARKIIHQEVSTNRGVVLNVVKAALKKVSNHKKIKIRLNPADLDFMNEVKSQMPDLVARFDEVIFEGDTSIGDGGCVIDTNFGDIDARIEKQLLAVEEMFMAEIRKRGIGR